MDDEPSVKIGFRANARNKSVSAESAAKSKLSGGSVETNRKLAGNSTTGKAADGQKMAKLDRENEVAPPPKVDLSLGKIIAQARQDKDPKWTQKDLATKINEAQTTIQSYESDGKAIPNPQVLGKMQRVLGVKLTGSGVGQPLGGPKKKDGAKK